jgi:hypothetical protein
MTLSRAACELRVYRLATLLTGDPVKAVRVIEAVVDAQPDVRRLDSAHLDRLTVLRSREIESAEIADAAVPPAAAGALARLPGQAREAWVLTHTYQLGLRDTSRAMDCSTTATQRHLEHAEQSLAAALGDAAAIAKKRFLAYSSSLSIPDFFRARRRRRQQTRRVLLAFALAAIVALILWVARQVAGQSPTVATTAPQGSDVRVVNTRPSQSIVWKEHSHWTAWPFCALMISSASWSSAKPKRTPDIVQLSGTTS